MNGIKQPITIPRRTVEREVAGRALLQIIYGNSVGSLTLDWLRAHSYTIFQVPNPMKNFLCSILVVFWASLAVAGPFDARAVFGVTPANDLESALKRAEQAKKRVLLFFWNSKEKENYPGLEMKYFAERQETKKLLKENFMLVLLDRNHKQVQKYLPAGNAEKAQWVLIAPDGHVIKQEAVYGNPDSGLKAVKELVALP